MKKKLFILGAVVLFVLSIAGCSLFNDVIVGDWQQVSVGGLPTVIVTVISFNTHSYTGSFGGSTVNTGTWTKSGSSYTLNGTFFGFISTSETITPTFSNSNNTMAYTDESSLIEIYNRQ
jgi:hypothetical protein